jgi:signal transduction histidine kinase
VDAAIAIIHDEIRHSNDIITGLLDYARVRTPERSPAAIVEIVERVLASNPVTPNIAVERDVPAPGPLLMLDAHQIQGAITNLVANAVDAMPNGGTLRVEVRVDPDRVVLAVCDTGPGLSPQIRAHLFEPLRSTKASGIGLGLVTARRYVEAHRGRLVCVDVAKGARFEIVLPSDVVCTGPAKSTPDVD